MSTDTTPKHITLDERNDVEKPLLDQFHRNKLGGLGWEIINLTGKKQHPPDTYRESFTELVPRQRAGEAGRSMTWNSQRKETSAGWR